jgi:SAM-dependent methyltransferase
MYRCNQCKTAFVSPMPSNEMLTAFYSNYHSGGVNDGNYEQESKMRSHHLEQLRRVKVALGRSPRNLLDIGCGKGFFLETCASEAISCKGLEISDQAADFARTNLGLDVLCGDIHGAKSQLPTFDAITMWGVIEHLANPVAVLKDAQEILAPGGLLFITTGLGNDWLDRLLPGVNQWYDPPQHLFVFSADGMRTSFERAGLELVFLDQNYDRTKVRSLARFARNAVTGTMLRLAAEVGRLDSGRFAMTRFPMANYLFAVARRP